MAHVYHRWRAFGMTGWRGASPGMDHRIGIYNGELFDWRNPDPAHIDLDTIWTVMCRKPRWGCHSWRDITVSEHSLRVERFGDWIAERHGMDPQGRAEVRLACQIHDCHEVYTPWGDCLAPGKTDEMRAVEAGIDAAIRDALMLPTPSAEVLEIVKAADLLALYWEAALWCPHQAAWIKRAPVRPEQFGDIDEQAALVWPRPHEDWLVNFMADRRIVTGR